MDWIRLSADDLESALNKPQLDILKAQALRGDGRDIALDVIGNIVARVRAEIAASGINYLDTDHSRIPPELKDCALRLAVEALQVRVPSMEISASQSRQAAAARETLLRVASGELPVSRPLMAIRTASKKGVKCGRNSATISSRKSLGML